MICNAMEVAKKFNGLTDANQYFAKLCENVPGFVKLGNNVYHYKDYFINLGKRFTMAGHAQCLMGVTRLNLSCLPEGVACIWFDNDEDMVLFTRIKGSENRRLIPYSDVLGVSSEAKQNLLADAERLMEENYAVLAITEGKDSWYVVEGEGRIIFSYCDLAFVSDEAKPAYRKRVIEALGL